jgi:hypothetical protein
MDNSLISCLCYFIYLYRTVVKRSDSSVLCVIVQGLEPNMARVSKLSILSCTFGFLTRFQTNIFQIDDTLN